MTVLFIIVKFGLGWVAVNIINDNPIHIYEVCFFTVIKL